MKAPLKELAEAAGLLLEWENSDGEPCQLSEQAQRNLLEVLGYSTASESAIEEGLQRLKHLHAPASPAEWPPLLTADCDTPITLPSPLPPGTAFTLQLEQGGSKQGYLDDNGALPRSAITSCR